MLNLSRFTRFSWGKISIKRFGLCKKLTFCNSGTISTFHIYLKEEGELVSRPPNDLCIDIWISVMSQHPDNRETGYSNVLKENRQRPKSVPTCKLHYWIKNWPWDGKSSLDAIFVMVNDDIRQLYPSSLWIIIYLSD